MLRDEGIDLVVVGQVPRSEGITKVEQISKEEQEKDGESSLERLR
jgi:hypothetical protein